MKKLLLIAVLSLLSSCALVDAYRMARFDSNEYMLVNQIHTQAQLGVLICGDDQVYPYVDDIYSKSIELLNYSASIPHNNETQIMTTELAIITKGLRDRYDSGVQVSKKYCELKFTNIETSTSIMKTVIGAKPR